VTCKDCIHYEACHDMYYEEHATRHFDPEKHNAEKECGYFKDHSSSCNHAKVSASKKSGCILKPYTERRLTENQSIGIWRRLKNTIRFMC